MASVVQKRPGPGLLAASSCAWGDPLSLGAFVMGVMLTVQAASSCTYCSDVISTGVLSSMLSPRKYLSLSLHAFKASGVC